MGKLSGKPVTPTLSKELHGSIISSTNSPRAPFTKKANSIHNNIAYNSFLGNVTSISLDLEAKTEHDHPPDFNFLPA